jgi:hypothetical protein
MASVIAGWLNMLPGLVSLLVLLGWQAGCLAVYASFPLGFVCWLAGFPSSLAGSGWVCWLPGLACRLAGWLSRLDGWLAGLPGWVDGWAS